MPLVLHQSSVQRGSAPSLGIHSASSPLKGSEKPSTSRYPSVPASRVVTYCFDKDIWSWEDFEEIPLYLQVTRLRYTPRKFVVHPDHNTLIVAEADHAAVPAAERRATENGMETDGQQAEVQQSAFVQPLFLFFACLPEVSLWCLLPSDFQPCRALSLMRREQLLKSSRALQRMLLGGGRHACGLWTQPHCKPQGVELSPVLTGPKSCLLLGCICRRPDACLGCFTEGRASMTARHTLLLLHRAPSVVQCS